MRDGVLFRVFGRYSEREKATIRRLYRELGPKVLAERLNRTETAIQRFADKNGLTRPKYPLKAGPRYEYFREYGRRKRAQRTE